ncbi:MAG: hypothetical protein Q9183_004984 [Haloplaca sp. 2 TL-2023]
MFTCKACISRCIRTIFADVLIESNVPALSQQSIAASHRVRNAPSQRRGYHVARQFFGNEPKQGSLQPEYGWQHRARRHQTILAPSDNERAFSPPPALQLGRRAGARQTFDFKKQKELDRELEYLRDPLRLAENTVSLLRRDDHEKALDIVRRASKSMPCTVSWNHLIDYNMAKGKVNNAEKIYNEMKKRAQKPDAQTYTIILRGLSWYPEYPDSLNKAVKIYHSMFAENCAVKPNVIHTNAALHVCALAKDLDNLWGVAARMPTKGARAPNNVTYTTILNALRTIASHNDPSEGNDQQGFQRRQGAVMQGRRIWEDIIPRWRAGGMWIDEQLVCAMGRLLLLGETEQDNKDVLSLAEQVMAIPLQTSDRSEPRTISHEDGNSKNPHHRPTLRQPPPELSQTTSLATVFRSDSPSTQNASTARPGRHTLSLLLSACINLRAINPAQSYWGLLTSPTGPYNIDPDSENYHQYLRVLRVSRASRLAAELVQEMHSGDLKDAKMLQPKTFKIAMSTCIRDKNNPNAMTHAQNILRVMGKTLEYPDVKTVSTYVMLASVAATKDYRVALSALQTLEPAMRLLRNKMTLGVAEVGEQEKQDIGELANSVVSAYDRVSGRAGDRLSAEEKKWMLRMKGWMHGVVERRRRRFEKINQPVVVRERGSEWKADEEGGPGEGGSV